MNREKILDILIIIVGNALLAFSVAYFVLPYDILSGGVAGISIILQKLFGWDANLVIDILIVGFFIAGYLFLGKEFALNTLLSSIVYPIEIRILNLIPIHFEVDYLLACIYGGLIAGFGMGIIFTRNGSTGGVDVIPLTLNKYTGIEVSKLVMLTDIITTIAGLTVFGVQNVLYGIIYIYTSGIAISKAMIPQSKSAIALYIISDKVEEICNYIHINLNRGTTLLNAVGGYSHNDREVILSVVSKNQYNSLSKFIETVDPNAFVIVSDAKEIKGEGFTYDARV